MKITKTVWEKYLEGLRKINDAAADRVREVLERYDLDNLSPSARQGIISWVYEITATYSEASGELACQMYDALAEASAQYLPPAEPAPVPEYSEVAKAVNGTLKTKNSEIVAQAASRLVKRTGVDTTMHNAIRDGAEWAWIPSGDTCVFCRILASRGWQKASRKALKNGHADHIHANCDCTYAISFNGGSEFSDIYDPDQLYDEYMDAKDEEGSWREAANRMRREDYAKNKDMINAKKRAAYFRRTGDGEERLRRVHFGGSRIINGDEGEIKAQQIKNAGNDLLVAEGLELSRREAREADRLISTAKELLGITNDCKIPFVIIDANRKLASYNPRTNTLYISKVFLKETDVAISQRIFVCPDNPNSTLVHELIHWKDAEEYRLDGMEIDDSTFQSPYIQYRCAIGEKKLLEAGINIDSLYEIQNISEYALLKWFDNDYDEVYTEYRTKVLLEG